MVSNKIFFDGVSRVSTQYRDDITQTGSSRVLLALSPCSSTETTKWLATGRSADLQRFRKVRGDACRAVREAKNSWFHAMAEKAQRGRFGGKEVWRCIQALQSGRRGLRPITRCTSIRDEEGNNCDSQLAKHQRWQRYFTQVLNVCSRFDSGEGKTMANQVRASRDQPCLIL